MPTTRKLVLTGSHARLQPLAALTLRDEVLPERIPAAGLIILRDGQPGEPEVTLSPLRYHSPAPGRAGSRRPCGHGPPAPLMT